MITEKIESTIAEQKRRYDNLNNILEKFMKEKKVDNIKDLNETLLDEFILKNIVKESTTYVYISVAVLNNILKENGLDIKIDPKKYAEEATVDLNKYFTKNEIINICTTLVNPQDKFILYALFNGIMGKDYQDLLNLKVSDVANDYSYININGKRIMCDDFMKMILEDTILTDYYVAPGVDKDRVYEYDMESPYVIKTRPSKMNSYGSEPMKKSGLISRLHRISNSFEDMNLIFSGKALVKSGIMYDMSLLEAYECTWWTIPEIKKYLELKCLPGEPYNLYKTYHQKYHDTKGLPD